MEHYRWLQQQHELVDLSLTLEPAAAAEEEEVAPTACVDGKEVRLFPCLFCDRKFLKSQALGGHQNAHKKDRVASWNPHVYGWDVDAAAPWSVPHGGGASTATPVLNDVRRGGAAAALLRQLGAVEAPAPVVYSSTTKRSRGSTWPSASTATVGNLDLELRL